MCPPSSPLSQRAARKNQRTTTHTDPPRGGFFHTCVGELWPVSACLVGSLDTAPNASYTLEFFASPECDPSGYGEGQLFLGRTVVSTDASVSAAFDLTLPVRTPDGWMIASTAIEDASGNTSEFSQCITVSTSACIADLTGDGVLDFFDVSAFLNAFNTGNALADLNGDGSLDFFDVSMFLNAYNAGCP